MKTYIVVFDVEDSSRLSKMKNILKDYGFYCPINENCWAVKVEKTAAEIRDELIKLQASSDRIFVVRSGVEAAWNDIYSEKHTKWLKDHL